MLSSRACQGVIALLVAIGSVTPSAALLPAVHTPPPAAVSIPEDLLRPIRHVAQCLISGDVSVLADAHRGDMPVPATVALLAGSGSVLSLIDLGDVSPLKAAVPAIAWRHLVAQREAMVQTIGTLLSTLSTTLLGELDNRKLETARILAAASAAALFAVSSAPDKLQESLLVFSAGWILTPLQDDAALRKLAWLAIHPGVPSDIRKEAGAILASSAALVLQQRLAEARLRASLGAP